MLNYKLLRNASYLFGINAFLLILLILSLLILLRDFLSPGFSPSVKQSADKEHQQIKAQTNKNIIDLEPIVKNNPFGFPGGELKAINLTETETTIPIDMRLIGTVSGGPDYAIFLSGDGKQEIFKRGERIFNSGILERVDRDRVIIFDGKRREIPLSDILTIETAKKKESSNPDIVRSSGNNNFIVSQEGIQHAMENPSQLMTDARLQPNYINGKQEGFILREVRNGGIYQSLGLQNGDVLLRINNYEITNPEIALQAFTALKGMDRVDLDILRNGSRMTLTYQIR